MCSNSSNTNGTLTTHGISAHGPTQMSNNASNQMTNTVDTRDNHTALGEARPGYLPVASSCAACVDSLIKRAASSILPSTMSMPASEFMEAIVLG